MGRRIKVLWPDGPRQVDEQYIIDAAHDVLCNEFLDDHPNWPDDRKIPVAKPDLEDAVEIVNDRGVLTTSTEREVTMGRTPRLMEGFEGVFGDGQDVRTSDGWDIERRRRANWISRHADEAEVFVRKHDFSKALSYYRSVRVEVNKMISVLEPITRR